MKKRIQKKLENRRKNFLPTLLLGILSWGGVFYLVFFQSPNSSVVVALAAFVLLVSVFLTCSLVLGSTRRGFLLAIGVVGYLALRFFSMDNSVNSILLLAILGTIEFYFVKR